jgi:hypothetical protein
MRNRSKKQTQPKAPVDLLAEFETGKWGITELCRMHNVEYEYLFQLIYNKMWKRE